MPIEGIGTFICDQGFLIDPASVKGEVSREIPIYCKPDLLCGGTDWKLADGTDLPECVPGNNQSGYN